MKYVVEFEGHDGKIRHTQPMDKMSCEFARILIPFKNRIIPELEVTKNEKEGSC